MAVKLNSTGGGSVTLDTPSTASNYTVTLPAANATLADTSSTQTLTNKTLTAAGSNTVEATSGPTSTQLAGQRNKIINGAMMIDQRNAGASVTINSDTAKFSLDRWYFQGQNTDGVFTVQQSNVAPLGFTKSMLITVTTADSSLGATQTYFYKQSIEGNNISDLGWGTASASTITLSFWVRSSLTGIFSGAINNGGFNRCFPFSFTINSANTWEYKTIVVPGDTAGTWATDNTSGLQVYFAIGSGSTYLGTANTWSSTGYIGVTGQTNLISTNGATFYITGVQLEKGATATPFENRLYGAELALCQRYYYKGILSGGGCTNGSSGSYPAVAYPTQMRTAPTIGWVSGGRIGNGSTDTPITGLAGTIGVGEANAAIQVSHGPAFTAGNGIIMYNTPVFTLSAEL